jgi:hypothetical protein
LRLEGAAEVGDVRLEGARGLRRRLLSPELVDEAVERDHAVGGQEQDGEDGALLEPAELQHPVTIGDLEGPENPELHVKGRIGGPPWSGYWVVWS